MPWRVLPVTGPVVTVPAVVTFKAPAPKLRASMPWIPPETAADAVTVTVRSVPADSFMARMPSPVPVTIPVAVTLKAPVP